MIEFLICAGAAVLSPLIVATVAVSPRLIACGAALMLHWCGNWDAAIACVRFAKGSKHED